MPDHRLLYLGQTDSVQTIPIIGQFCKNKEVSICSKTGLSKGGKILNVPYLTYLMVFNIVYINSTHKGMVCTSKSVRDTVVYGLTNTFSFFPGIFWYVSQFCGVQRRKLRAFFELKSAWILVSYEE